MKFIADPQRFLKILRFCFIALLILCGFFFWFSSIKTHSKSLAASVSKFFPVFSRLSNISCALATSEFLLDLESESYVRKQVITLLPLSACCLLSTWLRSVYKLNLNVWAKRIHLVSQDDKYPIKVHLTSFFLYLFSKRMHNLMKIKKKSRQIHEILVNLLSFEFWIFWFTTARKEIWNPMFL